MKIFALILLILAVASLVFFIVQFVRTIKSHVIGEEKHKIAGKERLLLLIPACATGGLLALSSVFFSIGAAWHPNFWEYLAQIFGATIFGSGLCYALGAFFLYYYKLDLDEKQRKVCKFWGVGFLVVVLSLLVYTEGIAWHIEYPLPSGFDFSSGIIRGGEVGTGFKVKFYGILIVSGALLCYAITDHEVYKKYKKHGLIDNLFIVAFLFGILGARLWYCFVLEPEYFLANPGQIIVGIVSGGLAIQGGALLGIIAGVSFVLLFRKYMDVRYVMDVAIPTILLAQAIGRMGNFFNQEVFGAATSYESLWFMPTILRKNMLIDGSYRVPLFYIEALMNIGGYFFIRYFLGKVCKFNFGLGYQAAAYISWYGMVRIVLELFRDSEFKYMQSWYTAFAFLGGGLLLMLAFYLLHRFRMNKGKEDKFGEKI